MIPSIKHSLHFSPNPGESASSFSVRLAHFVSPAWEKVLSGFVSADNAAASAIHRTAIAETIAELAGVDISVVLASMAVPRPDNTEFVQLGPFLIGHNQISQVRRRIAPQALSEDIARGHEPFHRSIWTIKAVCADPVTGDMLIEDCSACGAGLQWANIIEVGRCGECGQKLWLSTPTMPEGIECELCEFFGGVFHPEANRRAALRRRLPDELANWSEGALIEAIETIGIVSELTPHRLSAANSSDSNSRINGVRAILGGIRAIRDTLARPLQEAHGSSDRLANTIAFAQILATIDRNRSTVVRQYLKRALTECVT
jgi:hypothetical protein